MLRALLAAAAAAFTIIVLGVGLAEVHKVPSPGYGIRGIPLDSRRKGRGLWVTSGNHTPVHIEAIDAPAPGAPGTTPATQSSPLVVNFQLRPDPLAH
jgi:hypothetical protein